MSERPSRVPYFDNATLQRIRQDISSFQANRESVQIIGRNILHVLGTDLVRRFTVENPVKPNVRRNPLDIIHNYSRPTMMLAAGVGWDEITPTFRLLSIRIFLSAANTLKKRLGVQEEYQSLSEEVERRTKLYIDEKGISDQDQERTRLFVKYFDLSERSRYKLLSCLDAGEIDAFWQQLQSKVAEKQRRNQQIPLPRITPLEIVDGRRMFQVDREKLRTWLHRKSH